jgi:hypothetical protein
MISTGKLKAMIVSLARVVGLIAYTQVEVVSDYQILIDDNSIVNKGDNTHTFPLLALAKHDILVTSAQGTVTMDGNGSTIIGASSITETVSRRYTPTTDGWLEVT